MNSTFQEFSEFAVEDFAIKFPGEEKHSICGAVGSCEETLDAKTIKKKYKGIESKTLRGWHCQSLIFYFNICYNN